MFHLKCCWRSLSFIGSSHVHFFPSLTSHRQTILQYIVLAGLVYKLIPTMYTTPIFVSALLALAQAAQAAPSLATKMHMRRQANCTNVQVFVARGSLEEIPGRQGKLVDAVCKDISSCGSTDIQYPATFDAYCKSVGSGVAFALNAVETYAKACPNSKIVLTGYSQVSYGRRTTKVPESIVDGD